MKRELLFQGANIVFDNPKHKISAQRELLLQSIFLYALSYGREVKVVFFNGRDAETGVTFFFKREWPNVELNESDDNGL